MRGIALLLLLIWSAASGCTRSSKDFVVLYTSQDQFYAEPILREFTAKTGLEVRAIYDSESAKTAGLVRRLVAERSYPQCDVFWSNEELHTRLLVRDRVVASNSWTSAGSRTRRMVFNTNRLASDQLPKSLLELTNSVWNGRVALAYPLFGTTKSHFLALRQLWGEELWKNWCYGLVRNGARVVDGNSVVVKLVGAGECAIGLTDSDDISAGLRSGLPIRAAETSGEFIAIPSTIGLIRDGPHPGNARKLADYLGSAPAVKQLVAVGALENETANPEDSKLFQIDWSKALGEVDSATGFLEFIFVRS